MNVLSNHFWNKGKMPATIVEDEYPAKDPRSGKFEETKKKGIARKRDAEQAEGKEDQEDEEVRKLQM